MGSDTAVWLFTSMGHLECYFRLLGFWHLPAFVPYISECLFCGWTFLQPDVINLLHQALLFFLMHPLQLHRCSFILIYFPSSLITSLLPAASSSVISAFAFEFLQKLDIEDLFYWQGHPEPAVRRCSKTCLPHGTVHCQAHASASWAWML